MTSIFPKPTPLAYSATAQIDKIIEPLKKLFNVTFFSYAKFYWDLRVLSFTNNKEWIQYYDENKLYETPSDMPMPVGKKFFLDHEIDQNSEFYKHIMIPLKEKFNVKQSLTYITYFNGAICSYSFGSDIEDPNFKYDLLQNEDYLKQFAIYFSESARKLIHQAKPNAKKYQPDQIAQMSIFKALNQFFNRTKKLTQSLETVKRFYLDGTADNIYLTKSEMKCLLEIIQGETYNDIATHLGLSVKTIHNYVENIKDKLDCKTKSEIIQSVKYQGAFLLANKFSKQDGLADIKNCLEKLIDGNSMKDNNLRFILQDLFSTMIEAN